MIRNKTYWMVPVFIGLIIFLMGCTSYSNVSSASIKAYKQNIKQEFPKIRETKIRYSTPRVEFAYIVKKQLGENEVGRLFVQTRDFMTSPSFQNEVVNGEYKDENPSWGDPELAITITVRGNDVTAYQFTCKPTESDSDTGAREYTEWYVQTAGDPESRPYSVPNNEDDT